MKSISIGWKAEADKPVVFAPLEIQIEPARGNWKFLETDSQEKLSEQIPEKKLSCLINKVNCQYHAHTPDAERKY